MKHESLQLVNYDGQQIPSGYLFGDISARLAITYLKSIGAPETAVDKVKEVEVNKILYGIDVSKSTDAALGQTHVAMHNGTVYGGGNPMIPAAATQIKKKMMGEELAEGWTVETVQEYQQAYQAQQGQLAPQPPQQNVKVYNNPSPRPKQNQEKPLPQKKIENTDTCSLNYNSDSSVVVVDFNGNTPYIGKNLMYALKHYAPSEADKLERAFVKGNGKVGVSVNGIPEGVRDEVMSMVSNPDNQFTDIVRMLRNLDSTISFIGTFSRETESKLGIHNAPEVFELAKEMDFIKLYNSNEISSALLKNVFPTMYNAFKEVQDEEGKIPEYFELTPEMFHISDTIDKNEMLKSISQMAASVSSSVKGIGLLAKYANLKKGKNVRARTSQASYLMFPVAHIIATHSKEDSIKKIQGVMGDNSPELEEELSTFIDAFSKQLSDKDNPSDPLAEYKNRKTRQAETIYNKMDKRALMVKHSELTAKLMVALAREYGRPGSALFSEYGAQTKDGKSRNPGDMVQTISNFNLSSSDTTNLNEDERQRSTKVLQAIAILSFTNLGHPKRGSSFVNGLRSFTRAHDILSTFTDERLDPVDFFPFVKVSPLTANSDGTQLTFVDVQGEVHILDTQSASDEKKAEFAQMAFRSLNDMISSGSIDSSRSNVTMLLLPDSDFPDVNFGKIIQSAKENEETYLYSADAERMQRMGASVVQSFMSNVIDPVTGGVKVNTGIGGTAVSRSAAFASLLRDNPQIVTRALAGFNSIEEKHAFELEVRDKAKGLKEAENSTISDKTLNNIVNALTGIREYEVTMEIMSNPLNVMALMEGRPLDVLPQGASEYILSRVIPKLQQFRALDFGEQFKGHADADKKVQAINDYIVGVIAASATAEYEKKVRDRENATKKPTIANLVKITSATQPSESFEALSMVGRLATELLDYRNDLIDGVEFSPKTSGKSPRTVERTAGSLLENSMRIRFSNGKGLHVGLRKSDEKGSYVDAITIKTHMEGHDRHATLGFSELKTVVKDPRNAHMNATRNPARDIRNMIITEGFQGVKVQRTMNTSVVFGDPSRTESFPATWSMGLDENTDLYVDGNSGTAFDGRGR